MKQQAEVTNRITVGEMGRGSANDYSVGVFGRKRQKCLSGGDENVEELGGVNLKVI